MVCGFLFLTHFFRLGLCVCRLRSVRNRIKCNFSHYLEIHSRVHAHTRRKRGHIARTCIQARRHVRSRCQTHTHTRTCRLYFGICFNFWSSIVSSYHTCNKQLIFCFNQHFWRRKRFDLASRFFRRSRCERCSAHFDRSLVRSFLFIFIQFSLSLQIIIYYYHYTYVYIRDFRAGECAGESLEKMKKQQHQEYWNECLRVQSAKHTQTFVRVIWGISERSHTCKHSRYAKLSKIAQCVSCSVSLFAMCACL